MLRVSFVTVERWPDRRRITGSLLGCQRPLRLPSPPPSPQRSIGGRGQPPTVMCFRKITGPFHRSGSLLTCCPPVPMNYTPVIPSQKDVPQKYGAKQWRSEPQQSRQFSSKSAGGEGSIEFVLKCVCLSSSSMEGTWRCIYVNFLFIN